LITGLSHIAIAVKSFKNIEKWLYIIKNNSIKKFRSSEQGVNVISVKIDSFHIEFLEPIDNNSKISNFLKINPQGGIHHICFFVDNLDIALKEAKNQGIRPIISKKTMGIINNSPIAFLHPKDLSGVLVEFEQK
tara:strand:- start:6401 stop:6802 length:402 start_codon:yes stop_codon:yes gene_type:complete